MEARVHSSGLDDVITQSVETIVMEMLNSESYASDYVTKDQPHAANLLQTLHDSLIRHERYSAERRAAGKPDAESDRAKRLLQSLVTATNRRIHVGLPTVYAYLLQKPNHYCSHEFQSWSFTQMLTSCIKVLDVGWVKQSSLSLSYGERSALPHVAPTTATYAVYDYDFRPEAMERFPVYFFIAGTKSVASLHNTAWDWKPHADGTEHPCFRGRQDPQLFVLSRHIRDPASGKMRQLESQGKKLSKADHYREIRFFEPWRVPLLLGRFPTTPHAESLPRDRGLYALFVMMLLRPWRCFDAALVEWIGDAHTFRTSAEDDVWEALYDSYTRWRDMLSARAAPYFSMDPVTWTPAPSYDTDA